MRIAGYYRENLVKRAFNGLKNYFGLYGLGGAAEKTMKNHAVAANLFWIKKTSFLKWHKFIKEYAIPKKLGLNAAHGRKLTCETFNNNSFTRTISNNSPQIWTFAFTK